MHHSARLRREVELPVHSPSSQHQRRWQAKDHVRFDQDKGCWASILQLGVQESRCGPQQAVEHPLTNTLEVTQYFKENR